MSKSKVQKITSKKHRQMLILSFFVFILILPVKIFAATPNTTVNLQNPLNISDIPALAGNIIKAVLGIVGSVALLMFIWGGFLWLTSHGNPDRIKKGRETLTWAAIGLAFILSSYIIANFIVNTLTGANATS